MNLEPISNEEMYVLVAPDGTPQITTMAPDFEMCWAMCNVISKAGISQPLEKMLDKGFKILPVRVSIIQDGDENKPFKKK